MEIVDLKLTNFRNHSKLNLELTKTVNFIIGRNGSGKTNILEAIRLISTTKSFRARYDRDLIMHDKDFATVKVNIKKAIATDTLELQIIKSQKYEAKSSKKVRYNNVAKSLTSFATKFTTVMFSPESLDLINGSPSVRRNYIDSIFFQIDDVYKKYLNDYKKALKQRNSLLEQICIRGYGRDQLPYWNTKLLTLGEQIQTKRTAYFNFLTKYLASENLYETKYEKSLLTSERMTAYQDKEVYAKRTLMGPHLDDFTISFAEGELAQFGSRGQQRDAIFTLKLAEIEYLKEQAGELPVLLLDDIFSELDETHKNRVVSLITKQQTIITSAENMRDIKKLVPEYNIIEL